MRPGDDVRRDGFTTTNVPLTLDFMAGLAQSRGIGEFAQRSGVKKTSIREGSSWRAAKIVMSDRGPVQQEFVRKSLLSGAAGVTGFGVTAESALFDAASKRTGLKEP